MQKSQQSTCSWQINGKECHFHPIFLVNWLMKKKKIPLQKLAMRKNTTLHTECQHSNMSAVAAFWFHLLTQHTTRLSTSPTQKNQNRYWQRMRWALVCCMLCTIYPCYSESVGRCSLSIFVLSVMCNAGCHLALSLWMNRNSWCYTYAGKLDLRIHMNFF